MTAAEGQRALALHGASMGRFGPGSGAFLTPVYGGSEMAQAFCRVAAVRGALYVLRQPIAAVLMDDGQHAGGQRRCHGVRLDTGQVHTPPPLGRAGSASPAPPMKTLYVLWKIHDSSAHGRGSRRCCRAPIKTGWRDTPPPPPPCGSLPPPTSSFHRLHQLGMSAPALRTALTCPQASCAAGQVFNRARIFCEVMILTSSSVLTQHQDG